MAAAPMGPSSIQLSGAPDELIDTPHAKSSAVQVMQIELTQSVLDELLQCTRNGKPPQILFGRNPRLEYGDKSRFLEHSSENFTHELYRFDDSDHEEGQEEEDWEFSGLINHSLQLKRLQESSAKSDQALENLRNSLASIQEQRDAERTIISSAETAIPSRNSKFSAKPKGHLRTPSLLSLQKSSRPGSPSLSAVASPALAPTKTSMPETEEMAQLAAERKTILHLLAVRPASLNSIYEKTRSQRRHVTSILAQIAREVPSDSGAKLFELNGKSYRSLDPYKFRYTKEDREAAVNNAIRAFDRLRLSKEDKLWDILLPPEDRGKGKVLSRLGDLSQGPRNNTPTMKGQKIDRKTGLLKKSEVKKEKKPAKQGDEEDKARKGDAAAKQASQNKDKKPRDTALKTIKGNEATRNSRTPQAKPSKPSKPASGAQKASQPVSKPKVPSPLSSSPPVNASDFEDNHPVHKALQASASPAKKRKADDDVSTPPSKARKLHSSNSSASAAAAVKPVGTPTGAYANGASRPALQHASNGAAAAANTSSQSSSSALSSSQSPSPPLTLSWRQQIDLAQKFKRYYERYERLWHQLADNPDPPTQGQREELMRMHERLGEMKREIAGGRVR